MYQNAKQVVQTIHEGVQMLERLLGLEGTSLWEKPRE